MISQTKAPSQRSRNVAFHVAGPVIWARRGTQVKAIVNTVQEGCQAIADAVVEKRMKVQIPRYPRGKKKTNQTPAMVCNIEEWMQRIEENDSEVELTNGRARNCSTEQRNIWF